MEFTNTKPSNIIETDGNDTVFQTYVPKSLFGIVDVIVQFQSNSPQSFKVLPNGKIELQFLLEGSDILITNLQSLQVTTANLPIYFQQPQNLIIHHLKK